MSVQTRLPSIMTGKGRFPAAYLQPGEMIRLRDTAFVVIANAVITIQYEDGGWNILPMSAHFGKPLSDVPAWVADLDEVQAWFADKSRPRPMWRSLTPPVMTGGGQQANNAGKKTVAGIVQALRVFGRRGPAVAADVLEAANIRLDERQRALVVEQIADPTEARARDVELYESGWADAMAEVMTAVQPSGVNGDDLDSLRRLAAFTPHRGNTRMARGVGHEWGLRRVRRAVASVIAGERRYRIAGSRPRSEDIARASV